MTSMRGESGGVAGVVRRPGRGAGKVGVAGRGGDHAGVRPGPGWLGVFVPAGGLFSFVAGRASAVRVAERGGPAARGGDDARCAACSTRRSTRARETTANV